MLVRDGSIAFESVDHNLYNEDEKERLESGRPRMFLLTRAGYLELVVYSDVRSQSHVDLVTSSKSKKALPGTNKPCQ